MSERLNRRITEHLIESLSEWLSEYRAIFIHSADEPDMVIKPDHHNWHGKSAALRMLFYLPTTHIKMKEPFFVAFASPKGGDGRSVLSSLVAIYIGNNTAMPLELSIIW